ncbi:MAG: MATE family efflux transporter [Desulfovibrionaceae bacterium]|nr:MATE family efflux transporter [Desulfovibrionaceae bacterium]
MAKIFFKRNIDMLHGSLWDKLVLFAIPLALTNVLQQLFNTADVAVLGHYVGRNAMASVGSMTPVISVFIALFSGLSLGSNVVIAQYFGAKDEAKIKAASDTSVWLALFLGVVTPALCLPLIANIVDLLTVPSAISDGAQTYLRYYCYGLPAVSIYNFSAAMLRSIGDTSSPLLSLTCASLLNLILNLIFTLVLDLGLEGVALATTLANWLSALILVLMLLKSKFFHLKFKSCQFNLASLTFMLRIGLPAAIQGMVFCFSNVLVQSAINSLGEHVIAGSAAAFTIEINMYCLMSAFAQAATTFVSQNFGARNIARCLRVTRVTLGITMLLNVLMTVIILWAAPYLLGIFTDDPVVLDLAMERLWYIILPNVVTIFIDLLSGALRGYGCSFPPAIATLVAICGIRIVWVFTVFAAYPKFWVILLSYPLSWLATAILISFVYYRFKHHSLIFKRVLAKKI